MKKLPVLLSFLITASFSFGQNNSVQDDNAEVRNVSSFHAIEVSNGISLIIKQGNEEGVAVSAASADIRSRIKTEAENGKLKIYFDNTGLKNRSYKQQLKAYVSIKELDALEANSGADAITDGNISVNTLSISLSSGADFTGDVAASTLKIDQSSGSDMNIKGKAENLAVKTSSGSNFEGYNLVADNCSLDASSGSKIEITVNKKLEVHASSGSNIYYKGNASLTNISNSSGSKIKKQD